MNMVNDRQLQSALRRNGLLAVGLLLFSAAWFLPVHRHGCTLPEGFPGGQAFMTALSLLWERGESFTLYNAVLSAVSAATNVIVVIVLFAWFSRSNCLIRLSGWGCLFSLPLNAQWFLSDSHRPDLRIGYFVWWLSFGVLGLAIWCRLRNARGSPETRIAPPRST